MTPEFSGRKFGWQAARRGASFLVLMLVALLALDDSYEPDTDITPAEAVGMATFIGFCACIIFTISIVRPTWRRMRALRLPAYWSLIVPLLVLADTPYYIGELSESDSGSSISTVDGELPLYLTTAIGVVIAMTFARPAASESDVRRFGFAGATVLILATWILSCIVCIVGMAKWLTFIEAHLGPNDASHPAFLPMVTVSSWVLFLNPYVCATFLGLIGWCVVLSRR